MTSKLATIYGLFDDKGACHYVGQTVNAPARQGHHLTHFPGLKFKPIKHCPSNLRMGIERQTIQDYKAIGQCQLNSDKRKDWKGRGCSCTIIRRDGTVNEVKSENYDLAFH